MRNRIFSRQYARPFVIMMLALLAGCHINDYEGTGDAEYRESFSTTRAVAGKSELTVTNVNGTITIIGIDTLREARISGAKIVKDQSEDEARQHITDINIDIQDSPSALIVKTQQPNSGGKRTYQVNYELLVPSSWKVTVTNVNGNVDVQSFRTSVVATVVNGSVNTTEIWGSVNATATNGTITGKVSLPENGFCVLSLVNGNISLLVPRSVSASVAATVTVGTVSVANLPIAITSSSPTNVTGTLGAGKGTIRLTSVTGLVQLIGM